MKKITEHLLEKLAGSGTYERGLGYYEQGRVAELRRRGKTITAVVEGTESWRVTLKHTATVFEGSCDCPASENFDFCKHCVATALTYRDELGQQEQLKNASAKDRLPAYLMSLDKQALVDLTLELLEDDPPRRNALRIKADIAAGVLDDRAIKKQITAAIPYNRHLYRYAQVRNYFHSAESVLEQLEPQLQSMPPDKALKLIDYALTRIDRALETIDDSGGFRFHAVTLLNSLHLDTLKRSAMSPEEMAEYLFGIYTQPVSDFYPAIPDDYSEVLGAEGRKGFLAVIRQEWDKLPPLTSDDWDRKWPYLRLMQPLLDDAKRSNNKEAEIALQTKVATRFADYLELSAMCLENDQLDQALHWRRKAEKASKKPFHSQSDMDENQIAIWSHSGDYPAVLAARWRQFLAQPTPGRYQTILQVPGAGEEDAVRQSALAKLKEIRSQETCHAGIKQMALDTEAQIHLHYDQAEAALTLTETEPLHPDLLLQIAQANNKLPERTMPLYFRIAAFHVAQGNNPSYKEAIEILETCKQAMPSKLQDSFLARVQSIHDKYRQKRNFTKWLKEAFPEIDKNDKGTPTT